MGELYVPRHKPSSIWCDNKNAIALDANVVFHVHTKDIDIDLHLIKDKVLQRYCIFQYILPVDKVAYIFTKHLPNAQFFMFCTKLSIVPHPVHLWGDDNHPSDNHTKSKNGIPETAISRYVATLKNCCTR